MLRAGTMRHRVTIKANTPGQDDYGAATESWGTVATVWAEVRGLSGSEALGSGRVQATTTYRVWMRYRSDVTPAQRLVWGSVTLSILSVSPDNSRTMLELICEEKS